MSDNRPSWGVAIACGATVAVILFLIFYVLPMLNR